MTSYGATCRFKHIKEFVPTVSASYCKVCNCAGLSYWTVVIETRPGQARPTSPNHTSPVQFRPDQTRPDQTSPDQTSPVQTRPDQARPVKFQCFLAPLSPPKKLMFHEGNMSGYHCGSHLNLFGLTQIVLSYIKSSRRTKDGASENFCSCKLRLENLCLNCCFSLLSWKFKDEKRLVFDTGTAEILMLYLYLRYCKLVRYERVQTVGCAVLLNTATFATSTFYYKWQMLVWQHGNCGIAYSWYVI
jgi:hypothetical protein